MLSPTAVALLRADLEDADFTMSGVSARLGAAGLAGLARNSTFPARDALGTDNDIQAALIRLWILQQPLAMADLAALDSLPALLGSGLLISEDGQLRSAIEIKPYAWGDRSGWICSDQTPLDGDREPPDDDFVLGASPASTTLAQLTIPTHVERALDLGTGCGIQALHLNEHAGQLVATDLNPRALALAGLTLGLNQVDAELALGSLYQPVSGDFDLIVSNPPYVMSPPQSSHLTYRESGFPADTLMREVVVEGAERLRPGGVLQVLGNWAITDQPWPERLAEWVPPGYDALVIQREQLDVYEYIELWLADAGLVGTVGYDRAYPRWKEYFDAHQIRAVGMGWVNLRRAERESPVVRIEEWPHSVGQPVGAAIAGFFEAAQVTDQRLWDTAWELATGVDQETIGPPGAPDPAHIVLRQRFGLARAVQAGTELAAVAGACDGEFPLNELVLATAQVLCQDPDELRATLAAPLRELVQLGFLQRPSN
jgi:methylase of polypeptide subunit release factors